MPNTNIIIQTDTQLKINAQKTLAELGMDMGTAINIFLKQLVSRQAMPFQVEGHIPKTPRLGGWEGKIKMSSDFYAPLDDFESYM